METYGRFLFEFLNQFFSGFKEIFVGLWNGIIRIFNIPEYYNIIKHYEEDFSMSEWFLTGLAIIAILVIVGSAVGIIVFFLRRFAKWKQKILDQEQLLKEIDDYLEEKYNTYFLNKITDWHIEENKKKFLDIFSLLSGYSKISIED